MVRHLKGTLTALVISIDRLLTFPGSVLLVEIGPVGVKILVCINRFGEVKSLPMTRLFSVASAILLIDL